MNDRPDRRNEDNKKRHLPTNLHKSTPPDLQKATYRDTAQDRHHSLAKRTKGSKERVSNEARSHDACPMRHGRRTNQPCMRRTLCTNRRAQCKTERDGPVNGCTQGHTVVYNTHLDPIGTCADLVTDGLDAFVASVRRLSTRDPVDTFPVEVDIVLGTCAVTPISIDPRTYPHVYSAPLADFATIRGKRTEEGGVRHTRGKGGHGEAQSGK